MVNEDSLFTNTFRETGIATGNAEITNLRMWHFWYHSIVLKVHIKKCYSYAWRVALFLFNVISIARWAMEVSPLFPYNRSLEAEQQ
jgi:hypothetical protein